jgi:rod shape-determining protein MreC
VIGFILLGAVYDRVQSQWRGQNRLDPVSSTLQRAFQPLSFAAMQTTQFWSDIQRGVLVGRSLREENERLKQLETASLLYTEQVTRLENEIRGLRKLLQLPSTPGLKSVSADVIGLFPDQGRLSLNRGKKHGVRPGLAIIGTLGMIGIVQTVEDTTCQGMLLTSASATIGAMDASRNPPQIGLMRGFNGNRMSLTFFDPKSPVEVGDTIVTSGFGPYIPRGLIIGRVIEVQDNLVEGNRRAIISPAATLGQTREVKILQ